MVNKVFTFSGTLQIIGVNPYLEVPEYILIEIFAEAKKNKGPIPICGKVNGKDFTQTLVRYGGEWRLYINASMLKDSPKRIGEIVEIEISFDPKSRTIPFPIHFQEALDENQEAKVVFENLSLSLQKEIVRYIANLKSEESRTKNIQRAIQFLLGNERFIGRDKPR